MEIQASPAYAAMRLEAKVQARSVVKKSWLSSDGVGAYSQQIGFKSQDVIAASVLAVSVIREMSTPQVAPED